MIDRNGSGRLEQADASQINSLGGRSSLKLATPTGARFFQVVVAPQTTETYNPNLVRSIDLTAVRQVQREFQYALMNYGARRPARSRSLRRSPVSVPTPKLGVVSQQQYRELQNNYHPGTQRILGRIERNRMRRRSREAARAQAQHLVREIRTRIPQNIGLNQIQMPVPQLTARVLPRQISDLKNLYPTPSTPQRDVSKLSGRKREMSAGTELVHGGIAVALELVSAVAPETNLLKPVTRALRSMRVAQRPPMSASPARAVAAPSPAPR